jgi:hypothetical protein
MKRFRVTLNGKNFLLDLNGEPTKFGFHAVRYVKAETPEEAGKIAIILIHQNRILKESVMYEGVDRPSIDILEIKEVNALKFKFKKSESELKFYSEDDPAPGNNDRG